MLQKQKQRQEETSSLIINARHSLMFPASAFDTGNLGTPHPNEMRNMIPFVPLTLLLINYHHQWTEIDLMKVHRRAKAFDDMAKITCLDFYFGQHSKGQKVPTKHERNLA